MGNEDKKATTEFIGVLIFLIVGYTTVVGAVASAISANKTCNKLRNDVCRMQSNTVEEYFDCNMSEWEDILRKVKDGNNE